MSDCLECSTGTLFERGIGLPGEGENANPLGMSWVGLVAAGISALVLIGACSSDSGGAHCWTGGDYCVCGGERPPDAADFPGACDANAFGARALCCKGKESCECAKVLCGVGTDGSCVCGLVVSSSSYHIVDSCTGTASTCCTQDTGYCYCEEGCQNRFANHVVSDCDAHTTTATCYDDETQVTSCQ